MCGSRSRNAFSGFEARLQEAVTFLAVTIYVEDPMLETGNCWSEDGSVDGEEKIGTKDFLMHLLVCLTEVHAMYSQ